ncbi:aldolase [Pilatotrama ljubarskyi]|nr:aldolase [Pilatotrama ljubarskyi]
MYQRSPSPPDEFAPPTPAMPVATLRGKRRADAHVENGSSRIPTASQPGSSKTLTTVGHNESKVYLRGGKSWRRAEKSSIPFPTSSGLAPPVLTATHAGFADIAYQLLNAPGSPSKPSSTSVLGRRARPRPSTTQTKLKDERKKSVVASSPPLWRMLQAKRKAVIAETLDYELLGTLPFNGSMVTPSMLREGLLTPDTAYHAWVATKRAIEERPGGEWDLASILSSAMHYYLVELGVSMLDRVDGPHYTFVDPRLHDSTTAMVKHALRLVRLFAEKGYGRSRIVVTIPATEAGVQAARTLEGKHHVQTNLTLVSGLVHAAICAEADATCITLCYKELSEACGRKPSNSNPFIRAWEAFNAPSKRLADEAIQATTAYFNLHKLQSAILVANLQSANDAERLGEFDAVALTASQSLRARAPAPAMPATSAPAAGALAHLRACEAQYPTVYRASQDGSFLSAMPVDARTTAKVTLATGLKGLMEQMFQTSMHVLEFLQGEAQLAHVDDLGLQEFYEEDEQEAERLDRLRTAGQYAEQVLPIRWDDVGFRLRFSSWDQAEAYHLNYKGT